MIITLFQIACIAALLWSLYNFYVVWNRKPATTARTTGVRPSAAKPSAHPTTTKVPFPPSLDAGEIAHQQRGAAKTAKLPVAGGERTPVVSAPQTDDDEAMRTMFAQVSQPTDTPAPVSESPASHLGDESVSKASRKANRLTELGFHHSINPDAQAPTTVVATSPGAASPGAPRSNTAELNAILERIDQFLSEDPKDAAAKPATAVGEESSSEATPTEDATNTKHAKTEMLPVTAVMHSSIQSSAPLEPKAANEESSAVKKTDADTKPEAAKATPLWARADAVDEDVTKQDESTDKPGEQQRLF